MASRNRTDLSDTHVSDWSDVLPNSSTVNRSSRRSQLTVCDDAELVNPIDADHDREWQTTLVEWLGKLAVAREQLRTPVYARDLVPIVQATAGLVNEMAKFIAEHLGHESEEHSLSEFMGKVGWFLAAAGQVTSTSPDRTSWWNRLVGHKSRVPIQECCVLIRDLPLIMERSAVILGSRFRQRDAAMAWVKMSATFVAELRQSIRWAERLVPPSETPKTPQ